MVEQVKQTGSYEGVLYSVSGTLSAAEKVCLGKITNAFVFTGYGDHHAGRNFFGGGCYFNGAAIAAHIIKKTYSVKRIAVIDTDAHHGDGSWDIFENNPDVLYLCFCSGRSYEKNKNVNINVPNNINDKNYLDLAEKAFEKHINPHEPEIIFWNWGYDGTIGDYGDIGLTPEFHSMLALKIRRLAEEVCAGRLITVLCGGSRRDFAYKLIPKIIKVLAHLEDPT
jgi:acetoin utilization deacetylase AcuC-like enzyme